MVHEWNLLDLVLKDLCTLTHSHSSSPCARRLILPSHSSVIASISLSLSLFYFFPRHLLLVATLIAFKPSSVEALAVHYLVASHSCINRKTKKATLPPNNLQQWENRLKLPCLHLMSDHQSLSRWSD